MIAVAYVFKVWCVFVGTSSYFMHMHTFGNIDSLAVGCLLAFSHKDRKDIRIARMLSLLVGPLLFAAVIYYRGAAYDLFQDLAAYLTLWILIDNAKTDHWKWINKFFSWRPIAHLGKISYGVYVYHQFVSIAISLALSHIFGAYIPSAGSVTIFFYNTVATVLLAHFSFVLYERPFLLLKDTFNARGPALGSSVR